MEEQALKDRIKFLEHVIKTQEKHLETYKSLIHKCDTNRLLTLEAELKFAQEMNGILTEELCKITEKE